MTHYPVTKTAAILRGLMCRCPNCGRGKLFASFLKVAETCGNCGEELNHHRADDLPAYLIITIIGHLLVPCIAWVEIEYSPSYATHAAIWIPTILFLAVGLLQPVKGACVAVEWFLGLRGYAPSKERRLAEANASANADTSTH